MEFILKNTYSNFLWSYVENEYSSELLHSATLYCFGDCATVFGNVRHFTCSQGGRGNFTYLLEEQIHFALKLFVGRPVKQF